LVGILLVSVFLVATCGLIYELVAGALASYLLGDSVLQFSTIIGTYLFAMGVGSYAARYVERGLLTAFIQVQILVGLFGGCSAAILFLVFSYGTGFRLVLYGLVFLIGFLVGLEIPLLLRILKEHLSFKELVSQVLALDYVGALAASVLFPLFLVPHLGLIRTAFFFGMVNTGVAFLFVVKFQKQGRWAGLASESAFVFLFLLAGFVGTERITKFAEEALYPAPVIMSEQTPYQKLAVTRDLLETRLYLNNNLQFSTFDEYRYHEALVVPALMAHSQPRRVLVLGGGDGFAVDLLLRDPRVESIILVELDPAMIRIFRDHPEMSKLNNQALRSPKVKVVIADAFTWLEQAQDHFDLAFVDFPDPSNYSVGKLYTDHFYRRLVSHLDPEGLFVVQCSSPLAARRTFWSIITTMEFAGLKALPYHVYVPSFGEWGFALVGRKEPRIRSGLPFTTRFVNQAELTRMLDFSADMSRVPVEANRLFDQVLVRYFQQDWSRYRGRDGN
jgi:spermidine synthase